MSNHGFEWNLFDQIKLRECEIRLRNATALKDTMMTEIAPFAERHVLNPWALVRPLAIQIKSSATACLDEYRAIIADAAKVGIPSDKPDGHERRKTVVAAATTAIRLVEPILMHVDVLIDNEDARA